MGMNSSMSKIYFLTNQFFLHSIKEVEYKKAMTEKSKLLEDKREGLSPAESSLD